MSALIFVTQLIDEEDPGLGFVPSWIRALAQQFDRIGVIANEVRQVPADLDAKVVSLGKERGRGQLSRGISYEAAVWRMARAIGADALLAHQSPVYLNLAAPITKALGIRSFLWFASAYQEPSLKIAERLADLILTSVPGAYPRRSTKVHAIGQAIDTNEFGFTPRRRNADSLRLIALGRTSPGKHLDVCVRAIAKARAAGVHASLSIFGPATTPVERETRRGLYELIDSLQLAEVVTISDGVAHGDVPRLLADFDVLVNAATTGTADKAVFEAMATGMFVLVSNTAFTEVLQGLVVDPFFKEGDDDDLADRIGAVAHIDPGDLHRGSNELRSRVVRNHSMQGWAARVANEARLRVAKT
jgi:glycosyltransferase involved in cell wall biosynthesis